MKSIGEANKAEPTGTPAPVTIEPILVDLFTLNGSTNTTECGIMATEWSFIILTLTAVIQLCVVCISSSMALLGDTIHNFSDAATALPLWLAFLLARLKPNPRFTYGYGRVEDVAGVLVVVSIFASTLLIGWGSVERLLSPQPVTHLWAVVGAAVVGFLGNEAVAIFRLKIGREINSAALTADGYHARLDSLTSLSVILGAIGIGMGFPQADSIVGLFMTFLLAITGIKLGKTIFFRLLDAVDTEVIAQIKESARQSTGVIYASEVRARWVGHKLMAEMSIAVDPETTVQEAQSIAECATKKLEERIPSLANITLSVISAGRVDGERPECKMSEKKTLQERVG
jgi:cation diffusion facilitator family transporter